MSKEEFLRRLEEALAGEVPVSVIRENVEYYGGYISQEMAKGRTVDEIVEEIGEPHIVARTIIDSSEAAGETEGAGYSSGGFGSGGTGSAAGDHGIPNVKYFDLNKWYWKLLAIVIVCVVASMVFGIIGGVVSLLIRFSGPILVIGLVYWFIRNLRR